MATTMISWQMEPATTRTMIDPHRSWPRLLAAGNHPCGTRPSPESVLRNPVASLASMKRRHRGCPPRRPGARSSRRPPYSPSCGQPVSLYDGATTLCGDGSAGTIYAFSVQCESSTISSDSCTSWATSTNPCTARRVSTTTNPTATGVATLSRSTHAHARAETEAHGWLLAGLTPAVIAESDIPLPRLSWTSPGKGGAFHHSNYRRRSPWATSHRRRRTNPGSRTSRTATKSCWPLR